jgi:hypothetical protein
MKRVLKTRPFSRWMRKTALDDKALSHAVEEMESGLIDADLGGGVVKKRVALPGKGKSGSTRILLATNKADRWFFLFGFEKNERANLRKPELEALQKLATDLLPLSEEALNELVAQGGLEEIRHE